MRKKLDRRVEMTKKLLKKSLIELLKTESIQKISIRTLCQNADINRSTFYKHYSSQYDLLKDIEEDFFGEIEEFFSPIPSLPELTDADRTLQLTNVLTYMHANLDLCKILMIYNIDPDFEAKLMTLPSVIERSRHDSQRSINFQQFSYIQLFVLDGAYCMIKRWSIGDCQESPQEIATMIRSISQKIYNN